MCLSVCPSVCLYTTTRDIRLERLFPLQIRICKTPQISLIRAFTQCCYRGVFDGKNDYFFALRHWLKKWATGRHGHQKTDTISKNFDYTITLYILKN